MSLFMWYILRPIFPPLPKVGILGKKCWKEVVSELNIFVGMWSKITARKKSLFFADLALQNMMETTLPDGLETSGQRVYR